MTKEEIMAMKAGNELEKWVKLARQRESIPQEVSPDWERWVAEPVIKYPLAPREARAILEVFGYFASRGIAVADILEDLIKRRKEENVLTIITIEDGKIYLRGINASAASCDLFPGEPESYSDAVIIDWCNENLAAPDDAPDYNAFEVIRGEVTWSEYRKMVFCWRCLKDN